MLKSRRAPSVEKPVRSATYDSYFDLTAPARPQGDQHVRSQPQPFVRRRLSPEAGRALEILGHAIEYLADEYAADLTDKGPLGSADPRVAAIQILKGLNRAIYYSGAEVQPGLSRVRRWLGR
jgi:hypothetical protein